MTATTSLVSEIIRAANGLARLALPERRLLLRRGVSASRALRRLLSTTGKVAHIDEAAERVIEDIADNIALMSDETVSKAMLALAAQIRTMRILNRESTSP